MSFPQRAYGGRLTMTAQILRDRTSTLALGLTKLTPEQMQQIRQAMNRAHAAHGVPSRTVSLRTLFTLRAIFNFRLRQLWYAFSTGPVFALGKIIPELDPTASLEMASLSLEKRGKAVDDWIANPSNEANLKRLIAIVEMIEDAARDKEFKEAATAYRASMRGGLRPTPVQIERLLLVLEKVAMRKFEGAPIEGVSPELFKNVLWRFDDG